MSAITTMANGRHAARQQGFSLIEVSIVTAIVLLLAIVPLQTGLYVIDFLTY